ncbi:uncharacterized protein TrAtP1_000079 [Trichoderma atroviride]|nr:hypothetical protein TrAtP1_000079 [Trichoderma atroviride]
MTRGDSIPRYTHTMDFNPLDEQSPLADFWQMNDGLDSEDAAVIASLATQALQSKMGYEYEDSLGVNEPAEVANYTESRSSPQSQYSAIVQEEPAESFRGLMEDHDRGAQFSGADVTNDYDLEPSARGRISDTVAGFEEQAFMRDSNLHDPIYSLLNVSAALDEPRGTMTASQVVNEVLRNNELAEAQRQMDLNMQTLHSQAQLTPPDSESPSISAEERDHRELEEDSLTNVHEQLDDREPEDVVIEEPSPDTEAQQQLMAESGERPTMDEDEMDEDEMDEDEDEDESRQPSPSPAPRKAGRPRKSDTAVELPDLVPEESNIAEMALREKIVVEEDAVVDEVVEAVMEEAVADDAEINGAEEAPAARRRGRPRKSEIPELTPASSTKRGPGRPPKLAAPEATGESTPATGKRGRPRKSEAEDHSQVHTKVIDMPAEEAPATRPATGKRGRPRKSEVEDRLQVHAEESEKPAEETPTATVTAGKRGRPRRNTLVDVIQAPADASQPPVVETSASTPSLSKRGRPRKSDAVDTASNSTDEQPLTATEATNSTPAPGRRGRPRKSEVQNLGDEYVPSATETAVSTPAQGKRGRPPKSDTTQVLTREAQPSIVKTPTVTPATGKRGRPRKSDVVSAIAPETRAVPELQAESGISTTADITPSITETMGRNKPIGQDEALEEQHTPLFAAPAQKRGRGRPPKSGVLVKTATDLDTTAIVEEAEPQGSNSEHMEVPVEGMALDENVATKPVPDIWDVELTPAKKRGRPKSLAMDKPLPMISAPIIASAKKRGRPPKAPTAEEQVETLEEPFQPEAEETEERMAKRRRTDADVVMEGSIEDLIQDLLEDPMEDPMEEAMEDPLEESQPEAREERPASVRRRRVSFAADTKVPKSLIPIKFMRRNSDSTGLKAGFFSNTQRIPRLGGRTDSSKENAGAEVPFKSTATQQTELFLSRLPRPTVEGVFDGKKFGKRPKTYGKRLKK